MASVRIKYRMITAGDLSGSLTSNAFNTFWIDNIGIEIISTGTPTGTFSFEASNDSVTGTDGTWFAVTANPAPAAPAGAGATTSGVFNQYPWAWLRLKYTRTSGAGTIDVIAMGKEI